MAGLDLPWFWGAAISFFIAAVDYSFARTARRKRLIARLFFLLTALLLVGGFWQRRARPNPDTAVDEILAKQSQATDIDWEPLKKNQIEALQHDFLELGKHRVIVQWKTDDGYQPALDITSALRKARWDVGDSPELLPASILSFGIIVNWQDGYQPTANKVAASLQSHIGVWAKAPLGSDKTATVPIRITVGQKDR
jgi:hypothetical protein